mgnify:CR=1 FL=1
MRLQKNQIDQIHVVILKYLQQTSYELYLYGSRTDDLKKGGDIDLLILTSSTGLEFFKKQKLDLLVQIKKQPDIGQRHIDLKCCTKEQLESDPFLKTIWPSCKRI